MQMLRAKQVAEKLGCSTRGFYQLLTRNQDFPEPVRLGPRHVVWSDADVDTWLKTKKEMQDANQ